jgi:HK97 family phage prohead protease
MTHPDAPRDDLVRNVPFTLERAEHGDGLTLTGHGAVFNAWTEINSWEGRFKERVAPGAFKKTLQENGSRVRLQFDHGQHPLIGSLPIGAIRKIREDQVGLFVEARLADNWLVQPVREAIDNGSIDGMSFRFTVEKEEWSELESDLPERTITEVRLLELGPVVFPAYEQTDVGVRSLELARSLRNADEDTRREIAQVLLTPDTPDQEAAAGTSGEEAVEDSEPPTRDDLEHSPTTHHPAARPELSDERRARDLADMERYVLAATS